MKTGTRISRFGIAMLLAALALSTVACNPCGDKTTTNPVVVIDTSMGAFKVELYQDTSPKTVANFLQYVDERFYDGTIFHRVAPGYVIQGGGYAEDLKEKPTHQPVVNEAANGVKNLRGTLAMARTPEVNSATSQFFVNLEDNDRLNHGATEGNYGYAVFGKVIEGMDVVDKIGVVRTKSLGPGMENLPVEPVIIKSVRRQ